MQTLYLHIKNRTRVYLNSIMLSDIGSKTNLIAVFDIHKFMLRLLIICIKRKLVNCRQIRNPRIAYTLCYPLCKQRIAVQQETSLCNAVGLVVKFLRHHLVEILQLLFLQNFCMQPCHTVH